jgi:multiple sugar transport system substrate-binding protein
VTQVPRAALPDPRRRRLLRALAASGVLAAGCAPRAVPGELVFRHPKLFGDTQPFDRLIAAFEARSGARVRREALPASSDDQHLFYAISLGARSAAFDVLALDVVWVAEFARAGWIRDLSHLLPAPERGDLFAGPLAAVTWDGRTYALPWFVDAGLLYYRRDVLDRLGREPPQTWAELVATGAAAQRGRLVPYGYVWQGKQYEGLVCNALEFVWSHGGDIAPAASGPEAARGLRFMRSLVEDGITPPFVTTLTEEPSRVIFTEGRSAFLRNWPYAWQQAQRADSPVRGKVGVAVLPHAPGHASAATLGGWQLGVNARSAQPELAERLVAFLASKPAQKALAIAYGYSPPRASLYGDPELAAAQPFLASLRDVFATARPRPVFPGYVALSQVLQAEFSGVLAAGEAPESALSAIAREVAALEAA